MGFAIALVIMDAGAPPSRRGRRILIALLILLLILLPLYLWPPRGGLGGLPGATALPGARPDPRSAGALAQIPGDVWDALMGHPDARVSGSRPPGPRNLTMIAQVEELTGSGLDSIAGAAPLPEDPVALARAMIAHLGGPSDPSEETAKDDGSSAAPGRFVAISPGDVAGAGNQWNGFAPGGYPNPGGSGPWHGGGLGGGSGTTFAPGDPDALAPTPEPATLLLVGSNLVLLGAAAWRRRPRCQERPSSG